MQIDVRALTNEIEQALDANGIWVLSTASDGMVTSRSMSIIHEGLTLYFQTNACYIKHAQMTDNPHVALCAQNISIEGVAEPIGDWDSPGNAELKTLYRQRHPGSYDRYGHLPGQVVYRVTPTRVKLWKYDQGEPYREILFVTERRAERLDFM